MSIAVLLQKAKEMFKGSSKRMTTYTVEYNAAVKNERNTETDTIMGESNKHESRCKLQKILGNVISIL